MPVSQNWDFHSKAKVIKETWLSMPFVQCSRKQLQMHKVAETFRVLANEDRILMLLLLLDCHSIPLREFSRVLQLEDTTVSHHLHFLQQAGIITCHGRGNRYLCYSVNVEFVRSVLCGFLSKISNVNEDIP